MAVVGLGRACVISLVAEEAVCKDCTFVFVAVRGSQASCLLMALLLRLVAHIQGDCVTMTAAVEASEIQEWLSWKARTNKDRKLTFDQKGKLERLGSRTSILPKKKNILVH